MGFAEPKPLLLRQTIHLQVTLRSDPEGIRDTVEECEHRGHIHSFGDLRFAPAKLAQTLHVFRRCARCGFGYLLYIVKQCSLSRGKTGVLEISFQYRVYRLVFSSLDTQEVSMRVESIWAPIQI